MAKECARKIRRETGPRGRDKKKSGQCLTKDKIRLSGRRLKASTSPSRCLVREAAAANRRSASSALAWAFEVRVSASANWESAFASGLSGICRVCSAKNPAQLRPLHTVCLHRRPHPAHPGEVFDRANDRPHDHGASNAHKSLSDVRASSRWTRVQVDSLPCTSGVTAVYRQGSRRRDRLSSFPWIAPHAL
jgi:hypothetical protein